MNNAQLAQMHFVHGLADGNVAEPRRIYQEQYPKRQISSERTFIQFNARLCKTRCLNKHTESPGRQKNNDTTVKRCNSSRSSRQSFNK